jgi:hypothetical protein
MIARCRWVGATFAVLGLALAAPLASAQQAAGSEPAEYTRLVGEAVREYNDGNWAEARALFEQAHAVQPNARTERGMGLTSFELRHYVDAITELQTALDDQRNPLSTAQRTEVTEVIARAQGYVGTVHVDLVPKDAILLLNGRATDKCEFVLNVGDYELAAKAPGYQDAMLKLNVEGGQTRTVKVELVPMSSGGGEGGSGAGQTGGPSPGATQRLIGWTAVGVGGLGLALGVIFEVQRSSKLSDRNAICASGQDCTPDDQRSIDNLTSQAQTASTIGVVGLVSGVVFAAGGLVLVFTAPHAEQASHVSLAPRVGRDFQGAVLTARAF